MSQNICLLIVFLYFTCATVDCNHIEFAACKEPYKLGNCTGLTLPKVYFDSKTGVCKAELLISGCPGKTNVFDLLEECESRCKNDTVFNCSEPKQEGPCSAGFNRWFYNEVKDTCEPFKYTGCKGNTNRFLSRQECDFVCRGPKKLGVNCDLPKKEGKCSDVQKNWYFDKESSICKEFNYTGCGGNTNRFNSLYDCRMQCEDDFDNGTKRSAACDMPKVPGTKSSNEVNAQIRFYFDTQVMECKQFDYLGTGGNANRFATLKMCQTKCPKDSADILSTQKQNKRVVTTPTPTKDPNGDNQACNNILPHLLTISSVLFIRLM